MNVAGSSGAGVAGCRNLMRSATSQTALRRAASKYASDSIPSTSSSSSARRCFATTATTHALSKQHIQRVKKEHDEKLRLAIDLYHTTNKFFGTRPTLAKQEDLGMERVLEDPNDAKSRGAKGSEEHSRSSGSTASSSVTLGDDDVRKDDFTIGDVGSERASFDKSEVKEPALRSLDEQLDFHILAALHLLPIEGESADQYRIRMQRGKNPLHLRTASMMQDVVDSRRAGQDSVLDDIAVADLRRQHERPGLTYASMSPSSHPTQNSQRDLPDPTNVEAVRSLIAETARNAAQRKRQSDLNARDTHISLDNRSARVRDALFGTVAGRLPGLEVVRDRLEEPRVQEEVKRLLDEAAEAAEAERQQKPRSVRAL